MPHPIPPDLSHSSLRMTCTSENTATPAFSFRTAHKSFLIRAGPVSQARGPAGASHVDSDSDNVLHCSKHIPRNMPRRKSGNILTTRQVNPSRTSHIPRPILPRHPPCTQLIALLCPRPISSQALTNNQRTELEMNLSVIRPVVIIIVGALVSRGVSTSGDIIRVVRRPGQSVVHLVVVAPANFPQEDAVI